MNSTLPIIDAFQETREALADDPHRPLYHFLSPGNWMNDPNGMIHWKGKYHLFYQYNPEGAYHGHIHWGHAVSPELVHWEDRPIALTPTPGGPDTDGCWSGSAVDAQGVPMVFYSGVQPQTVCVATGSADLNTWQKYEGNPVIAGPPADINAGHPHDFRDPYVWRDGKYWYMVMGSRIEGVGGTILLYRSADLLNWEYVHPLLIGDQTRQEPFWMGTVWECPNLVSLGGRHVLIVSFQDHARGDLLYVGYHVGDFAGERFAPEALHILEYGGHFYAPQVMVDEQGRRIMMGWLTEGRSKYAQLAVGWSGVMSLPRVLSLGVNGGLLIQPIPELKQLRGERFHLENRIVQPGEDNLLDNLSGDCLEIEIHLETFRATAFSLRLRCSPEGEEQTIIRGDFLAETITIDRSQTSLDEGAWQNGGAMRAAAEKAPLVSGQPLHLHVFLDRSVLEVFVNDQIVLSSRIYPTRPDSLGLELFAEGGPLLVHSLDVWTLAPIWPVGRSVDTQQPG